MKSFETFGHFNLASLREVPESVNPCVVRSIACTRTGYLARRT
jgi:hypothetical protein